jgi:hypothetical protein
LTGKDKYRTLCRTEPSIPVFSQDWWLDTVCGEGNWDVMLKEEKGKIQAAMPVYLPLSGIIIMPPFTQTMGPWFRPATSDTKYVTCLGQRQEAARFFASGLKKYAVFMQNFHYKVTDWLPFYWEGYRQTTRYTYLLDNIKHTGLLWENMSPHIRRHINKAKERHRLTVKRGVDKEDFLHVNALTFKRQGREPEHTGVLKRLLNVSAERGQGDIWGGYDEENRLHAAVFIVWQDSSAYYIAGGADPALRDSGAHALVMWEAIRAVSEYTTLFDFEGSMLPGVERFFRGFGATQTPYFAISKGKGGLSLWSRMMIKLKTNGFLSGNE